jgi:uncharacterized membrane protein
VTGGGRRRDDRAVLILWAMIVADAVLFSWIAVARHWNFQTGRFDLGNMVQAVWTTGQGDLFTTTDTIGNQISRLGAHVDPILVAFTPFSWFLPTAEVLLVGQAVITALGALPVFWLGRRWLADDRLALAGAAAYLLYPPVQHNVLVDFHPVVLATPLLLFCIWAAEEQRWWALAVFAPLAALTKEQVGIALVMLGVWIAVRHRRLLPGAILAVTAGAWSCIAVFIILPAYNPYGGQIHVGRYAALGDSTGEILTTVVTRPWVPLGLMVAEERVTYMLALLLPLLALCLLAPLLAAGALPDLVLNLLGVPAQHAVEHHYTAVITPFLIASALLGLARLRSWRRPAWVARAVARPGPVAAALVLAVILAGVRFGPFPWVRDVPLGADGPSPVMFTLQDPPHVEALKDAIAMVPPDAVVSASNEVGGHLSERRRLVLYPQIKDADWVVIDGKNPGITAFTAPAIFVACLGGLNSSPFWELRHSEDAVLVYERIPDPSPARIAERPLPPGVVDPAIC